MFYLKTKILFVWLVVLWSILLWNKYWTAAVRGYYVAQRKAEDSIKRGLNVIKQKVQKKLWLYVSLSF